MRITEEACAKLNLYLSVGERRPDGYHDVLTYMRRISLSDTLTFSLAPADTTRVHLSLARPVAGIPTDGRNLIVRAAALLLERAGVTACVDVLLDKNVPSQAGLGGGSSDAAATLRAVNRWLPTPLATAELEELGRKLGADVPFFVTGTPSVCRGRGDELTPLTPQFDGWCVLLEGDEPSATGPAYAAVDRYRLDHPRATPVLSDFSRFSPSAIANDFEGPVGALCPSVPRHLDALRRAGAEAAAMSGSGSAVFGWFADRRSAEDAVVLLRAQGFSPLLAELL